VVAAVITPTPDAMTMLIFMAPMIGLYFVGIAVSAMVVRKKERQLAAAAEAR
jgi:sec-independent protein translocase protein TatC